MAILSATKATKVTLQKRRNLFGLGTTSLIAACSTDGAGGGGNKPNETDNSVILPFKSVGITDSDNQLTTSFYGNDYQFTVEVKEAGIIKATLTFTDGKDPEFGLIPKAGICKLTAIEGQYDLVISSANIDTEPDPEFQKGRIFIFWNMADIKDETIGRDVTPATNVNKYLEVKGGHRDDTIGIEPPEFFQINDNNNSYDMVFRSLWADKENNATKHEGGFFIVWDVTGYAGSITVVDLGSPAVAAYGSLAIHGAMANDYIGTFAPEFLQIGGATDDQKYDMIIRSDKVAKDSTATDAGAIYILWDVADYQKDEDGEIAKKVIDLGAAASTVSGNEYATSGLLTIYGAYETASSDQFESLGSDSNNILYGDDGEGDKILTDIDGDIAGTNDIAFRDKDYTYILFGDKVAHTGDDDKVDSKTIDLAVVETALTAGTAGFFGYDFDGAESAPEVARVGYRFVGRKADLAAVQADYDALSSSLSDTDADLGVWDIA